MKRWRLTVIILIVLAAGSLVATAFLADRFNLVFPFPAYFRSGQIQAEHPIPGALGNLIAAVSALFTLGISGILVLYIAPKHIRRVADSFPGNVLRLTLSGILVGLLVLAVGISSALMIGTFPITILLTGSLFVVTLVGLVSLAYSIGRSLLRRAGWQYGSPVSALLLGSLMLVTLSWIPLLGAILFMIFASLGLGATILSHFGSGEPWTLTSLLEERNDKQDE
jgi:hypothetical protein